MRTIAQWILGVGAVLVSSQALAQDTTVPVASDPGTIFKGRYEAKLGLVNKVICRMEIDCQILFKEGIEIKEVWLKDPWNWKKEVLKTMVAGQPKQRIDLEAGGPGVTTIMEVETTGGTFEFFLQSDESELARRSGVRTVAYRDGEPVAINCPELRMCMIDFEPGEKIMEPMFGADNVRWEIKRSKYGTGAGETEQILIKAKSPGGGFDANLVVNTERRSYVIDVVAVTDKNVAYRTKFWYPQNINETVLSDEELKNREVGKKTIKVSDLNFNFCIAPDDLESPPAWTPTKVYDNGKFTYVQFPEDVRNRELPTYMEVDKFEDDVQVRDGFDPSKLILTIKRMVDQGRFQIGTGRKAEQVWIYRGKCDDRELGSTAGNNFKPSRGASE